MKKIILMTLALCTLALTSFADSGIVMGGAGTGSIPKFVGLTTLAYDGNDMGTYALAAARCVTDTGDSKARVCTNEDMGKLVESGETFGSATDEVWVNGFAPGYTAFANDCNAWSSVAVGYYARYFKLADKVSNLSGCAMSKKYACCK